MNLFKKKPSSDFSGSGTVDVASCIQKMFDDYGIIPVRQDNMFLTVVEGTDACFKTVLNDIGDNSILVYAPFPIAVPEHAALPAMYELNRLNELSAEARLSMKEKDDGTFSISATLQHRFDKIPDSEEIKGLMLSDIAIMDEGNFASLASAIFGFQTYAEVMEVMQRNAQVSGENANIEMKDGYIPLLETGQDLSSHRYGGRLPMFAAHIVEAKISAAAAQDMLNASVPFDQLIQKAYNLADEQERDSIRKLLFLMKATDATY